MLLLALLACLAYSDSFRGAFVFDDGPATVGNPTLRSWTPPWRSLEPPEGTTVAGRPIANLTLAINYAASGTRVWSYHALNLAILVLGGLTLFGIVRRTLRGPRLMGRFGRDADLLALATALLWVLHPLQTESITYIVQRVESLMGLFYLLTLYCFIRSLGSEHARRWQGAAVAACALGMGTKEVMVTAPMLVLLYDWVFVPAEGSVRLLRRGKFYLALAFTWAILAFLVAANGFDRNGSAGFTSAYKPTTYWLVQARAVVRYLHLCLWPNSLTLDYGPALRVSLSSALLPAALVILLLGLTLRALIRRLPIGYLGAWFFVILAPTCIVPVGTQAMAEHRIYLSLAAVVSLLVLFSFNILGRRCYAILGALALGEGAVTFMRNAEYRDPERLWSDTVAEAPDNPRAHCSLGQTLAQRPDRLPEAIEQFQTAIRLHPNYSEAHADLGMALAREPGRTDEAISELQWALRIRPAEADWQAEMGSLLCSEGLSTQGLEHLERSLALEPGSPRFHYLMGNALTQSGRIPEAQAQYEEALRLQPDFAEAGNNLGILLCRTGHLTEGMARIRAALAANPHYASAHFSLGLALLQTGRKDEAASEFEAVLQLKPHDPGALHMLQLLRTQP